MHSSHWKNNTTIALGLILFLFYANYLMLFAGYKLLAYLILVVLSAHVLANYDSGMSQLKKPEIKIFYIFPTLLLGIGLLPLGWISAGEKSLQNIFYFIFILFSISIVLEQIPKHLIKKIEIIICITLIISVIYNFYGSLAINHEKSHFSNLHYAAQFALTTSFILTYCLLKGKRPVNYVILLCCLLACGWILINTLSRPAWIALVLTVGCALVLFFNRKHALFGIAGLTIISILLYLLLPDFFSNRVDDLIENIKTEERVQIWSDALTMQASNNIGSWLIGHGPGSYETFFRAYNNFQAKINFPHNFILEILFESGIVGLTLITLLYQKLYASIFRMHKQQPKLRPESMLMFMCITANLILSFLTFPFYSKYVLLYQAPFMAITLYLSHTNPTPQKPLE